MPGSVPDPLPTAPEPGAPQPQGNALNVVALDPGRLSGVVTANIARDGAMWIEYYQEISFTPGSLFKYLVGRNPDILVCEQFTYRPKHGTESGLDLYPCYLLGVCHLFVEQRGRVSLYLQEASQAKGSYYGQDDTLSTLGVYFKGGKGHARDATRHLLTWFYDGEGFKYNKQGVQSSGLTKDMKTEKQKAPAKRRKRNTGEIPFD